jgi:hypothetical protein
MTRPCRWIVVDTDGSITVHDALHDYRDIQAAVGGDIEAIPSHLPMTVYVHEEGKYAGPGGEPLAVNHLMTALCRSVLMPGDYIAGPAAIFGPPDTRGEETDVPPEIENLFVRASAYWAPLPGEWL